MMADDIALARVMDTMAEGETGTGKELASIRLVLALVAFATLCQQPAAGESFRDFQQRDAAAFRTWQQEGSSGQQSKAASNRSPHASKGETAQQVVYAGRADADGRKATLTLDFKGEAVTGRLLAKGVTAPNARLPTTDIRFGPIQMTGPWESERGLIAGDWTGGDYIDGQLLPGYPTNGVVTISIRDGADGRKVRLKRISTSIHSYIFDPKGSVIYQPATDSPPLTTNTAPVVAGYWSPVGYWLGSLEWSIPVDGSYATSYRLTFSKGGTVAGSIVDNATGEENRVSGTWKRKAAGIEFELPPEPATPFVFDGPNKLSAKISEGFIVLYRNTGAPTGGGTGGTQTVQDVDPARIAAIAFSPAAMEAVPGTNYPLPRVVATMKDTAEVIELTGASVKWMSHTMITPKEGRFEVSKNARPGMKVKLRGRITVKGRIYPAACEVAIVKVRQTGVFKGRVGLWYDPRLTPGTDYEREPRRSTVTLSGPGGPYLRTLRQGEKFCFEHLPAGSYVARITSIELPTLVEGYVSNPSPVGAAVPVVAFYLPDTSGGNANPWVVKKTVFWPICLEKDYSHCVYGIVSEKGRPIWNATITLSLSDGSSQRESKTNGDGIYRIDTDKMDGGLYYLEAMKWVDSGPPYWANDGDLMDIASSRDETPLTVNLPVPSTGVKIDIPCLTRKECLGSPSDPPSPTPESLMPKPDER